MTHIPNPTNDNPEDNREASSQEQVSGQKAAHFTPLPERPAPDFEPEDEDYVTYAVTQLVNAHRAVVTARREAGDFLQNAVELEQAQWNQFEDYLLEATRWHRHQTGQERLSTPLGSLRIQDAPGHLEVTEMSAFVDWALRLIAALPPLSLAATMALRPSPTHKTGFKSTTLTNPKFQSHVQERNEVSARENWPQESSLDAQVSLFYQRTGLQPAGCRLIPAGPQLILELP